MKICSLYGAGFYYIPGTDMCLKVGGWVRFEVGDGHNGNLTLGGFSGALNNRATSNMSWRSRGYITADARNQTEYGTVRSYIAIGINTNSTGGDTPTNTFSSNRAFIQWAGFTFGLAQSFFDFYSVPATAYWGSYPASDTGDPGWQVAAYTAQFGNGLSATISAEQRRQTQIIATSGAAGAAALGSIVGGGLTTTGGAYGGFNVPDVVGNLRVDQAWGSAQVMAAAHQVNGQYYGATGLESGNSVGPSDTYGWAVGGGLKLNAPMIGKGDYFQAQVNYAVGASRYIFSSNNMNYYAREGGTAAYGVMSDSVYGGSVAAGTTTGHQLTSAWGVNAAYEHFWNARWRTSLYGGYAAVNYGSSANAMLCVQEGAGAGAGTAAVATAGCDNNWSTYWVGTRTQWNVTPDFYLGLDVMYQNLKSAQLPAGTQTTNVNPAGLPVGITAGDNDVWQFRFRAHKDFYP